MPTQEEIWERYDSVEVRLTARVSERMLDLADLQAGKKVLDLATGRGEPAVRAAKRVAPGGRVLGIDLSEGLLAMARERATAEEVSNIDLRVADVEAIEDLPRACFDAVTCRWGLMYLNEPVLALENARRALSADGVLVAALWAEPERVPYYSLPRRLLEPYRAVPVLDFDVPGTFRCATLERIERDFGEAGWRLDHLEEMEISVFEAENERDLIGWTRALGLEELLEELPEAEQRAWEEALVRGVAQISNPGSLRLGGVTRIVRARPLG